MSKKKSRAERARDIALYRYALIRPLADPGLSATERGRLVRELAAQVHLGPSGEPVTVSRASLDRWIRAWRAGGFDALIPGVSFHLCKSGVVHHRTAVGRTEGVFCDQDHADAG
ncbi:helix-turn-helix domain-containing protein [Mycobacterium servetii]|uniref:Helix-turn-helix domain-containing protein n=1 Tax=Mycobacterium servetii TaxID=3237418 RepID=A0ABV4BZT7_9MYCO